MLFLYYLTTTQDIDILIYILVKLNINLILNDNFIYLCYSLGN